MDIDDFKLPSILCGVITFGIAIIISYILLMSGHLLPNDVIRSEILALFNTHSDIEYRLYIITYELLFGVTYGNTVLSSMVWGGSAFFGAMLSRGGKNGGTSGAIGTIFGIMITFVLYILIQNGDIMSIIDPSSMIILTILTNRIMWPLIFSIIGGIIGGLITRKQNDWG